MPYMKEIACLANSRRPGGVIRGHCVAGKEIKRGEFRSWVRPVIPGNDRGLKDSEILCDDGQEPQLLDIVRISFMRREPEGHQTENHVINEKRRWERIGKIRLPCIPQLVDQVESLWINGFQAGNGINDRIPVDKVGTVGTSLLLIQPSQLTIHKEKERGAWKTRADFTFCDTRYCLVITDRKFEAIYREAEAGDYPIEGEEVYLTVSLAGAWEGYCFKLVAGVLLAS